MSIKYSGDYLVHRFSSNWKDAEYNSVGDRLLELRDQGYVYFTDDLSSYFNVYSTLGEGSHGLVVRGSVFMEGQLPLMAAIKIIKNQPQTKEEIERDAREKTVSIMPAGNLQEITVLGFIRQKGGHPNLIGLQKAFLTTDLRAGFIAMDYCENGTIGDVLCRSISCPFKKNPTERDDVIRTLRACEQLITGLDWLHSNGIVHGDLTSENVFMDKDYNIRIGDFGGSLHLGELRYDMDLLCEIQCVNFRSPEVALGFFGTGRWSFPIDMWSLGLVIWLLFKHTLIFNLKTDDNFKLLRMMVDVFGPMSRTNWSSMPVILNKSFAKELKEAPARERLVLPETGDLLANLFIYDPEKRWTSFKALDYIKALLFKKSSTKSNE